MKIDDKIKNGWVTTRTLEGGTGEVWVCIQCKKKLVRFKTTNLYSYNYGFCSKTCIADATIKKMNLEKCNR